MAIKMKGLNNLVQKFLICQKMFHYCFLKIIFKIHFIKNIFSPIVPLLYSFPVIHPYQRRHGKMQKGLSEKQMDLPIFKKEPGISLKDLEWLGLPPNRRNNHKHKELPPDHSKLAKIQQIEQLILLSLEPPMNCILVFLQWPRRHSPLP